MIICWASVGIPYSVTEDPLTSSLNSPKINYQYEHSTKIKTTICWRARGILSVRCLSQLSQISTPMVLYPLFATVDASVSPSIVSVSQTLWYLCGPVSASHMIFDNLLNINCAGIGQ